MAADLEQPSPGAFDDYATLTLSVLDARDNVVVIFDDARGRGPRRIVNVNAAFTRVTGYAAAEVTGGTLARLQHASTDATDWARLQDAIALQQALEVDLRLSTRQGTSFWFGCALSHPTDPRTLAPRSILVGRDITVARRKAAEANGMQRLLASVFLKVNTAVAIVRADGRLLAHNPAFQRLFGYTAEELVDRHVSTLVDQNHIAAARAAHARQLDSGQTYHMRLGAAQKDGRVVPVLLTSERVEDANGLYLRIVTLIPEPDPAEAAVAPAAPATAAEQAASPQAARSVAGLWVISLKVLKQAYGAEWDRIAVRAMLVAENIIRRRLADADVCVRTDAQTFSIWYGHGTDEECTKRTAAIARTIRIHLLGEFGEAAAAHVTAVTIREPDPSAAGADPAQPGFAARLQAEQQRLADSVPGLFAPLRTAPPELVAVVDRDRKPAGMAVVDLPQRLRRDLARALAASPEPVNDQFDADLLGLDQAIAVLLQDAAAQNPRRLVVPVPCGMMLAGHRRQACIERLSVIAPKLRTRLLPVVADLPDDLRPDYLEEPLRMLLQLVPGIGVQLASAELGHAPLKTKPFTLVVVDATNEDTRPDDGAFALIATPRQRGVPVLVRLGSTTYLADWRELGANFFAVAPD
jgi:PAS domain S-box-containing protein